MHFLCAVQFKLASCQSFPHTFSTSAPRLQKPQQIPFSVDVMISLMTTNRPAHSNAQRSTVNLQN